MRRRRRIRRFLRVPRVFIDRGDPLHGLDDEEIFRRYRFRVDMIQRLVGMLAPRVDSATRRSHAVPAYIQILITLRFLATGAFQSVVGDLTSRVSQPTCSRIIHQVCRALTTITGRFILFPSGEEARRVKQGFFRIAGKIISRLTLTSRRKPTIILRLSFTFILWINLASNLTTMDLSTQSKQFRKNLLVRNLLIIGKSIIHNETSSIYNSFEIC